MITNVFLLVIVILLSFLCFQLQRMSVISSQMQSVLVKLHQLQLTSTTKKSTSKKQKKSLTSETSSVPDSSPMFSQSTLVSEPSEQKEILPSQPLDSSFDFSNLPLYIKCSNCSHCKNPSLLEHGIFEEASCHSNCELISCGKPCEFSFYPSINRI